MQHLRHQHTSHITFRYYRRSYIGKWHPTFVETTFSFSRSEPRYKHTRYSKPHARHPQRMSTSSHLLILAGRWISCGALYSQFLPAHGQSSISTSQSSVRVAIEDGKET